MAYLGFQASATEYSLRKHCLIANRVRTTAVSPETMMSQQQLSNPLATAESLNFKASSSSFSSVISNKNTNCEKKLEYFAYNKSHHGLELWRKTCLVLGSSKSLCASARTVDTLLLLLILPTKRSSRVVLRQ